MSRTAVARDTSDVDHTRGDEAAVRQKISFEGGRAQTVQQHRNDILLRALPLDSNRETGDNRDAAA